MGIGASRANAVATLCYMRRIQILGVLLIGICLHAIFPSTATARLAWAVSALCVVAAITMVVGKIVATLLAQRKLGIRIGIISGSNQPPLRDEEAYLAWCTKNNLVPYGAS